MINKPIYLMPFILVYRIVKMTILFPVKFVNYAVLGFIVSIMGFGKFLWTTFYNLIRYILIGFKTVGLGIYSIIRLIGIGVYTVFSFILKMLSVIFINIYKGILFIFKTIYQFFKYSVLGFLVLSKFIYSTIYGFVRYLLIGVKVSALGMFYLVKNTVKYPVLGFIFTSYFVYKTLYYSVKYPVYGFIVTSYLFYRSLVRFVSLFSFITVFIGRHYKKYKENQKKKKEEAERKFIEKQQELIRKREERIRKEAEIKNKRVQLIEDRKRKRDLDTYQNTNVKIEKKNFGQILDEALSNFIKIPVTLVNNIKKTYNSSAVVKNMKNKRDIEREALLISFEVEDDRRSSVKQLYEYVARNEDGKVVKGYFDAYSRVEVHSFLLGEGMEVYSIKTNEWLKLLHGSSKGFRVKIKTKDLIFFLTQLSTYIKAGIPLVESLKILTNQFTKNKKYQRLFRTLIYDLTMGDSLSEAMVKQGDSFPRILINMVKASEMTGQLPEVLDDMSDYFTEIDKTRKQMVTVMMYPALIFVVAVVVIGFIMIFVIPRFVQIYESLDGAQIPAITLFIMAFSEFLQNSWHIVIIGFVAFVMIFRYLYKNVKLFKTLIQWILMHIPVVKTVIIYNEVTMFSKTFSSLLSHNVFITESMDILNKVTNNEIYKMLILDTITNLAKGDKISTSFRGHWAFPAPAYEMIVTGEKTGELPEMMAKVASYYQEQHKQSVARIKAFIEPILIVFLTTIVGGIVLSIVIPMFNLYNTLSG